MNKNLLIKTLFIFFVITQISIADDFDITAKEILIDKNNQTITAEGDLVVFDENKNNITGDKGVYYKKDKLLEAIGSVLLIDTENNQIETDKIIYTLKDKKIETFENSKLKTRDNIEVTSNSLNYLVNDKVIYSNELSNLIDTMGHEITMNSFLYSINKKIFSSKGYIKVVDTLKNEFFFDEVHIDTLGKKLVGSNIRIKFNKENFEQATSENDPRLVANTGIITKAKSIFNKGVFTLCKQRGEKCPPWSFQAKKIIHDKLKKTIYYRGAVLKVYDFPVFYFPRFFHPDPTVKRQSGFLNPSFTDSSATGFGFNIPYFWAVSLDKDMTITPKFYANENSLMLVEYRQATKNSSLILDTSFTEGYKDPGGTKSSGSRNHFFTKFVSDLNFDGFDKSKFDLKLERVSNDTYFKVHKIDTGKKTGLVSLGENSLLNEMNLNLEKKDAFFNLKAQVFENTKINDNSRYEYILPNFKFGNKIMSSEKLGEFDWETNIYYKQYDGGTKESLFINDFEYNSASKISSDGIVTELNALVKNTNYDAEDSKKFKNEDVNHEVNGAIGLISSYPLQKLGKKYFETFIPKTMLKISPGHMRNLTSDELRLNNQNIFSLNKVGSNDVLEAGTSVTYGFDYKKEINEAKNNTLNSVDFSLGQILNLASNNENMPNSSSLNKDISDIVGSLNLNFADLGDIKYDFLYSKDIGDTYYNLITSNLNLGRFRFNLDYLEENEHIGNENYINQGIEIEFDRFNSLSFDTRKNFKTDSTEFYNLTYEYLNDCLRAAVEFKREFYNDKDIGQEDTLRFTLSIIPYTKVDSPSFTDF